MAEILVPTARTRPPYLRGSGAQPDFVVLGDSRSSTTPVQPTSGEWETHLVHALGGRLKWSGNYATPGYTSVEIQTTHLPSVLALSPRPMFCVIYAGTNDLQTRTTAEIYGTLTEMCLALMAVGITPVVVCETPRTSLGPQCGKINALNSLLRMFCQEYDLPCAYPYPELVDPLTGDWLSTSLSADGTHPGTAGDTIIGGVVADVIESYLPPFAPPFPVTARDDSHAVANPTFEGTSGATMTVDANNLIVGTDPLFGWYDPSFDPTTYAVSYAADADPDLIVGKWMHIDHPTATDTSIRWGNPTSRYLSAPDGALVELGMVFKIEDMDPALGNAVSIWWGKNDSPFSKAAAAVQTWAYDLDPTRFYWRGNLASHWNGLRMCVLITGPAGPRVSVAQIVARNLTLIGA